MFYGIFTIFFQHFLYFFLRWFLHSHLTLTAEWLLQVWDGRHSITFTVNTQLIHTTGDLEDAMVGQELYIEDRITTL